MKTQSNSEEAQAPSNQVDNHFEASDYGDVLAVINDLEKVSFETGGGYQGEYKAVLTDGKRDFYYFGSYGSCSGCDWLEDVNDYINAPKNVNGYWVPYKEARDYCADIKPTYIVPKVVVLEFSVKEYDDFKFVSVITAASPDSEATSE